MDRPAQQRRSLGKTAARGGAATIASQLLRTLILGLGLVVLARLLSPREFGMVAVVVGLIGFGEVLRDFGLSNAAIQAPSLSRAQRDNLFWVNIGVGTGFSLLVLAGAPSIAAFYDIPELTDVTRWLAVTFVLNGFATQYRAGLVRDLRFGATATIDVVAPFVALVVAVVMALSGAGYWSLVGQEVTKAMIVCAGVVLAARWWPRLPRRSEGIRSFLNYGAHVVGAQLLGYASRNAGTVALGARAGADVAGLYSRAFQIVALPITQLSFPTAKVALPVLSRLNADRERYARFLLHGQTVILHVIVAPFALAAALAEPVVAVVLGEQWSAAAPVLRVLAIGGAFEAAAFATAWVFLSKAATASQLRYFLVTRPVVILAVVVASQWGMVAVATAYAVTTALTWPVGLWWIARSTDAPAWEMFTNAGRTLAVYTWCGGVVWLVLGRVATMSDWLRLGAGVVLLVAGLALAALCWPRLRSDLRDVWSSRRLLLGGSSPASTGPAQDESAPGGRDGLDAEV